MRETVIPLLTGPTAIGKSAFSLAWALQHPEFEIIQADSLTVYQGFDRGTAKPTLSERRQVPHHLIDIRHPLQPYTAADFARETERTLTTLSQKGKRALITGGTAFYLKALLWGVWDAPGADPELRAQLCTLPPCELFVKLQAIDPIAAQRIGKQDTYRLVRALEIFQKTGKTPSQHQEEHQKKRQPAQRFALLILDCPPEKMVKRIQKRTHEMLQAGLIEEYQSLSQNFPQAPALRSVGYAQVGAYLRGDLPSGRKPAPGLLGLEQEIQLATQQLVKKQRTALKNLAHQAKESGILCREIEFDSHETTELENTLKEWI